MLKELNNIVRSNTTTHEYIKYLTTKHSEGVIGKCKAIFIYVIPSCLKFILKFVYNTIRRENAVIIVIVLLLQLIIALLALWFR